jgi:endogenous inhibitor of DNA gyrase (YacG/DUF329 family)
MSNVKRKCQCCGKEFEAKAADVKRGWAKFCSKSCKAIRQEQRTGAHRAHSQRQQDAEDPNVAKPMSIADLAGGGYGMATKDDAPGHDKW